MRPVVWVPVGNLATGQGLAGVKGGSRVARGGDGSNNGVLHQTLVGLLVPAQPRRRSVGLLHPWIATGGEPYAALQTRLRERFPELAVVICPLTGSHAAAPGYSTSPVGQLKGSNAHGSQ